MDGNVAAGRVRGRDLRGRTGLVDGSRGEEGEEGRRRQGSQGHRVDPWHPIPHSHAPFPYTFPGDHLLPGQSSGQKVREGFADILNILCRFRVFDIAGPVILPPAPASHQHTNLPVSGQLSRAPARLHPAAPQCFGCV